MRFRMARLVCVAVLMVSGASLACGDEPIVLGALYNSTGPQAGLDGPSLLGAKLAVAEANAKGGVLGRPVALEVRDGHSEPELLRTKTSELLAGQPSPVALFGLSDTDLVLAAAPLAARDGRVFITSGATSPRLPGQVPEWLFLACFGDNVQAAAAAEWVYQDQKARTALVIFDDTHEYTKLLEEYFQIRFQELGGTIREVCSFTSENLEKSLTNLPRADVVFLAAQSPEDIRRAVKLIREAGITCPIVGGDSFDAVNLWQDFDDADDVFYTTHAYLGEENRNPRVVAFREAFAAANPSATCDGFAALGYDTAQLVMHAVEASKTAGPDAIRQALSQTKDFRGVTGTINYAGGSRIPTKSVSLIGVGGGKLRLVREITPESVPAP